jgi:hypothetical protein
MRRRELFRGIPQLGAALVMTTTVLSLGGCGPRTHFAAKPMLLDDGVHVEVTDAFTRGDRIFVEAWITNDNKKRTIRVNPDAWAIKLPTGELVSRRVFATDGDVLVFGPGQGHRVNVDFRQEGYDLKGLGDMRLVVGGIAIGQSSTEYVVGEIQLDRAPDKAPAK